MSHHSYMPNGRAPLVSIILPCYLGAPHQEQLLMETLQTVAEQTYSHFEAILVDDGSPIAALAAASRFAFVRTLRQANAGSAVARNTGIAASRGEYLVFLDADDYLLPPALDAGVAALEAHPECGFAVGRREEMSYDGSPVPWGVASVPRETSLYKILLGFDWYIIPPSSAIFRREAVEAVGGFRDPWGADDLDFYLRIARRYEGWCSQEPAVTRYRRYSASSSRDGERMLTSIREVYRREWEFVKDDPELRAAYHKGLAALTEIFRDCLAENFRERVQRAQWRRAARATRLLLKESPRRLAKELRALCSPSPLQA